MKKPNLMKTLAAILSVAMVLVFATGCNGGGGSASNNGDAGGSEPLEAAGPEAKTIGFYADADVAYYSEMRDALLALVAQDPECAWTVDYQVGDGTAEAQTQNVDNFITANYDAIIVIQNNTTTTSECIAKAKEAGIPYFGAGHDFVDAANAKDSTGSVSYNYFEIGRLAGADALANGVRNVIMIEGLMEQGSALLQTYGFLYAYEEAGKSFGQKADGTEWTAQELVMQRPAVADIQGVPDLNVVAWYAGNWRLDIAQQAMSEAIELFGENGWDGVYAHNNPMMEGVLSAMETGGLTSSNYWLGTSNGGEAAQQWAREGLISFDVNQSPCLEGAVLYQMLKEYFQAGKVNKAHVYPYLTPYTKDSIETLETNLVSSSDIELFVYNANAGIIAWNISDPIFEEIPNY